MQKLILLALTLAACGSDPTATTSGGAASGSDTGTTSASASGSATGPIVVGSASFGESEILAEIYAQALQAKGIDASTHLDIGQREAYIGALKDGSISLFPEYTGNLLTPIAVHCVFNGANFIALFFQQK